MRSRRSGSLARPVPVLVALCGLGSFWILGGSRDAFAASAQESQARIEGEIHAGRPVVVHLVVALCDNTYQGIVPVPRALGNGQDPASNLYWGARYGVKTYLTRQAGWTILPASRPREVRILERAVFFAGVKRGGTTVPVYVVADAWDGAQMRGAIETFLAFASGARSEEVLVRSGKEVVHLAAGGAAHLVGFVGHNGLMDSALSNLPRRATGALAGSSLVLACASKPYFLDALHAAGSHPLLLTTGLMAPEAYTLDAALRAWIGGGSAAEVREASARAYQKRQKFGLSAARELFWGESP